LVVELNTGGLDRPCHEFCPGQRILELCYQHHVPVTLSSDAHRTAQIARHFSEALGLLLHTGFNEIVGFSHRTRRPIKL
jgi:histidinol-phosphatase (PHP family)